MFEKTTLFNIDEIGDALIETTLMEICDALREKGYDPTNQLVGYILSNDASYITNFKKAREKIQSIDREKLLEVIVRSYLED